MGGGNAVDTLDKPDRMFEPVIPNTTGDRLLKTVCGRLNQRK